MTPPPHGFLPLSRHAARRRAALAWLAGTGLATAVRAQPAAAWPTQPVKILVGFPGGSTPDMAARVLAEAAARAWGQPVVVDNRPGASGNVAADAVAKATDDHTLGVVINGNLTTARLLNARLPFDPASDFTPLSLLTTAPLVLVAPASAPEGRAFFDAARAGGGQWNYGSVGVGSVGHLGMELLKSRAGGLQAQHVPYNGNPAVLNAMLGGQVQMALVPPGLALPQVRAGKLRAIGLTGGRSTLAPEVGTLASLGVNADELEVWTALVGPASLSRAARARIAADVPSLMRGAEARQRLFAAGWQVQATAPEALRQRVAAEREILAGIVRARGIQAE